MISLCGERRPRHRSAAHICTPADGVNIGAVQRHIKTGRAHSPPGRSAPAAPPLTCNQPASRSICFSSFQGTASRLCNPGFLPRTNEISCQLESVTCVAMETARLPQICPFVSKQRSDTVSSPGLKRGKRKSSFSLGCGSSGRH